MNKKLKFLACLSSVLFVLANMVFLVIYAKVKVQHRGHLAQTGMLFVYGYAWYVYCCYFGWRGRCLCLLKGEQCTPLMSKQAFVFFVAYPVVSSLFFVCCLHLPLGGVSFGSLWLALFLLLVLSFLAMKPVENAALRLKGGF